MIGIIGTLLGTIVGWVLGIIGSSIGKLKYQFDYAYLTFENEGLHNGIKEADICFETIVRITNTKSYVMGINNCKVILVTNKKSYDFQENLFMPVKESYICEFDKFMNIQPHSTIEAKYKWVYTPLYINLYNDIQEYGCKVFLEYKRNGKNRAYKKLIYKRK